MTSTVLVLFEVDPDTNEAIGSVHTFCSEACRDACLAFDATPDHPGAGYAPGTQEQDVFGFDPKCESCGIYITDTQTPGGQS